MLSADDIVRIYDELETLQVELAHVPELGPDYLKGKLVECRAKQNRCSDLLVLVSREHSAIRSHLWAAEALIRANQAGPADRVEYDRMRELREDVRCLVTAVSIRRANLSRTSSDIRLLADIVRAASGAQPHTPSLTPPTQEDPEDAVDELLQGQQDEAAFKAAFTNSTARTHPATTVPDPCDVDIADLLGESAGD